MVTDTEILITKNVRIPLSEVIFQPIRAQGAGGQNVNKVSSAIQLRFDIKASSLPERYKEKLLAMHDRRITNDGVIVIKAQTHRTQEKNKEDGLIRLEGIIREAGYEQKARTPTKPSRSSRKRRVDSKVKRGKVKSLRRKVQRD